MSPIAANTAFTELRSRLAEVHDLQQAVQLLEWDQLVKMPPLGGPVRAHQLSTLEVISHDRAVDPAIGRLLDELRPLEESLDHDSDDASFLRVARRDWEKARRIPTELAGELRLVASEAQEAWAVARAENDYAAFRPWLDRNIELRRRYIDCFDPADDPYDVLLDDFEPGMKTAEVRMVFDRLKPELRALASRLASDDEPAIMRGPFPEAAQERVSQAVLKLFGLDERAYRLDREPRRI